MNARDLNHSHFECYENCLRQTRSDRILESYFFWATPLMYQHKVVQVVRISHLFKHFFRYQHLLHFTLSIYVFLFQNIISFDQSLV
jgi:hypothetical protein